LQKIIYFLNKVTLSTQAIPVFITKLTMNGYELWRLREYGLSGVEVQRRNSEFWAKRNLPVERLANDEAKLNLTCGIPAPSSTAIKRPRFTLLNDNGSSSSTDARASGEDFSNVIPDASACHWWEFWDDL